MYVYKIDNMAAVLITETGGPRVGEPLSTEFPLHTGAGARKVSQPMLTT